MLEYSSIMEKTCDAISIRFNNRVYEMKQKGIDVIVLSLGEAFFNIPLFPFSNLPYPDIYHYSHSRGIIELRRKITDYYSKYYEVNANPEKEMIITAGSKIAIYLAFKALLNPEEEVLIPEPAWVSYTEQVKLCYATPITIPYWESVFNYEKYITTKTKLMVINNPNNPSGKVYSYEELSYLLALCKKYNIYLLSDEAYSDFVNEERFYSAGLFDPEKKYIIICNSISKNFGISGWRIGYTIANSNLTNVILKLNQHLITCAPTILQYYLIKNFDEIINITYPQIKTLLEQRKKLIEYMNTLELNYLPGSSTFYFFVSIGPSSLNSEEFCMQLLEQEHISTVPGIGYGKSCDKLIRVSVGTEPLDRIQLALNKIKDFIIKTSSINKKKSAEFTTSL